MSLPCLRGLLLGLHTVETRLSWAGVTPEEVVGSPLTVGEDP